MKLITGIIRGNLGDLIEAYQAYGCYPENINQMFEIWAHYEGKKVEITTERRKDKRSEQQNRFWYGVVLPLCNEFSREDGEEYSEWEWHEYFIHKGYFGYKEINGELIPKRSSEATTLEFNEAIRKVQQFWALRGRIIPDPNQTEFLEK